MTFKPVPGSEFTLECELVLLAMGFTGPERSAIDQLGVKLTDRGTVSRDETWMTNVRGRLHRRRHAARSVADRLGHRRGPQRRARRRSVAQRPVAATGAALISAPTCGGGASAPP